MRHPSDISAQTSFLGHSPDDKRWKAEQKRKKAKPPPPNPIPDGPCCVRCRNWTKPEPDDDFGSCQKLVTIIRYASGCPDRGYTAGIEEAMSHPKWAGNWEHMRTKPSFVGCSRYDALVRESEEAA